MAIRIDAASRRGLVAAGLLLLLGPASGPRASSAEALARAAAAADSLPSIYAARPARGEIRIHGVLDDPGWQDAVAIENFFEVNPGDNAPPKARTVARITYDADHIYCMARCYDPAPAKIRAHVVDRDQIFQDDCFGLLVDTF